MPILQIVFSLARKNSYEFSQFDMARRFSGVARTGEKPQLFTLLSTPLSTYCSSLCSLSSQLHLMGKSRHGCMITMVLELTMMPLGIGAQQCYIAVMGAGKRLYDKV